MTPVHTRTLSICPHLHFCFELAFQTYLNKIYTRAIAKSLLHTAARRHRM